MNDHSPSLTENSQQHEFTRTASSPTRHNRPRRQLGRRPRHSEADQRGEARDVSDTGIRPRPGNGAGSEIHVICIYPTVQAGKLARRWIEEALGDLMPRGLFQIEYFNYDVLSHNGISWEHICERFHPDIIMMLCDGNHPLDGGLRHSLRDLFHQDHDKKKPLVLFKDLEAEPSLNARTILDYLSVLSQKNHCELNALNGNGGAISSFRHQRLLLRGRQYRE